MIVERRGWVTNVRIGPTGNRRSPHIWTEGGSLQIGGTSRMSREAHVRSCERLWVKLPGRLDRHIAFAPRAGRDLSPGALFPCQKKDPAEAGSSSVASRVSGRDGHPGGRTHDLELTGSGVDSTLRDLLAEDGVVARSLRP